MRGIVRWSLQVRTLAVVLAMALLILGVIRMRAMPVDVLPEFSPPYVEIQTESLGLSAEEVEQLITVPMEQDLLNGVPWVDTIRSDSVPGLSSIVIVFKPGTDLMRARQMVAERMTQAVALPHVSKPPTMLQPLSSTGRVMIVGLSSKSRSLIEMGVLARWTIAPRLMGVPGVANVAVWGQRDRQLQVLVDPARLRAQNTPLSNVLETAGNALWVSTLSFVEASTPGTGGFIDTPNQRLGILHLSPIITADGLAQVPISDKIKSDGTPLRLGDVANVVEDHQPLIGDAIVDGGSGLLLVVEKFPGSNALEVTRGLEEALAELQPGLPDITINTTLYRPATFIETALGNVTRALLLGAVMLILVLAILYWNWRMALISAVTVLLSLGTAVLVLSLRGATLNVMVLAGLLMATGVVIDDAIVDVEHIARRLRQRRQSNGAGGNDQPVAAVILEASARMRGVMFLAMLIILLAVSPILFVEGSAGAFFQPLAFAYGMAVLASLLVALVVTPALCLILLSHAPLRRESPLLRWLLGAYEGALKRIVGRPRLAWLALTAIVLLGAAVLPFLRLSLLPNFKERDLVVHLNGAPGMSQPEMSRIAARMSHELRSTPGVKDVGALIGRAVLGDQVVNVNSSELWVSIDPGADYFQTVAAVQAVAGGYPGLRAGVQTYLRESSSAVATPTNNSIAVRIYGNTDEALRGQAQSIQQAMTGIRGIAGSHIALPVQQLTVETEVDIDAAQRYGLKPGDVRRAAATLLSGIQVGNLFEQQKIFDVVVWSTPEARHSLSSVRDLLIDTPSGGQVRLGDVAQVRIVPAAADIRHEAVKRYLDVILDVKGRDLGAVAADVKGRLGQLQFPLEYHAAVLEDYAASDAARNRVLAVALAALIGIFFLLQAAFGSWRLAGLAFMILPFALAGGVLPLFLTGSVLSLGSLAGLIVVLGIVTRNGILLINQCQELQRHEGEAFGPALALHGVRQRFAPVVMTALATGLGFAASLFLGDVPGLEIMRPMAIVILGGLVTGTAASLFILPSLYLALDVRPAQELELNPVTGVVSEETLSRVPQAAGLGAGK